MLSPVSALLGVLAAASLSLSLLSSSAAANDGIRLCSADTPLTTAVRQQDFYGAGGELMTLALASDSVSGADCASIDLPETAAGIRWIGLAAPATAAAGAQFGYRLQGVFPDAGDYAVSEVDALGSRTPRPAPGLRIGENLLLRSNALLFGSDERSAWLDDHEIQCRAGNNPAGVQYINESSWPAGVERHLLIEASGRGEFQVAVSDQARIATEQPLPIGVVPLGDSEQPVSRQFPLPAGSQPWQALTIACPQQLSSIRLHNVAILPGPAALDSNATSTRSAWLWSPRLWQQDADTMWRIVAEQQLQELYLTIPVADDGSLPTTELQALLAEASARGIQVWPVIGDRRDVLPTAWPALRKRISAYARFNAENAGRPALAGVQLDIEPYLLPGFNLNPAYWRDRYLQTIDFARGVVGPLLRIDLAIPVWWGSQPDFGSEFLARLVPYHVSLTIMNYRTNSQQLLAGAQPFLNWGDSFGREVSIGLEAGSLQDEMQRLYRPANATGELWEFAVGNQAVLALFAQPVSGLPGQAFGLTEERLFSASNLTFQGNLQRLQTMAGFLTANLSRWTSFRGVSLHGLDEVYRGQ